MTARDKLIEKIMSGTQDGNVSFDELKKFLEMKGYSLSRMRRFHHIFTREKSQPFNIQRFENGKAKRAQIREVRLYFMNEQN